MNEENHNNIPPEEENHNGTPVEGNSNNTEPEEENQNTIPPENPDLHPMAGLINDAELPTVTAQHLMEEKQRALEQANVNDENKGMLTVKQVNHWIQQAKNKPIPKMLFDEFWHEGEVCILFADTNLGKSILAVQIANSISRGEPINGFRLEAEQQPVLYLDFELSDKQFELRYSHDYANHYTFCEHFHRAEINYKVDIPKHYKNFEEFLHASLERSIIETGARVVIVDNLTYLRTETEQAKDALPLMKGLNALATKYGLSIMTLAHTPKRDLSKPINRNDLQGSKALMNFCDSSFAIGESSSDKNLRYLKQIKVRSTSFAFDEENVCVCQIYKPDNFLQFELMSYSTEREHLRQVSEKEREKNMDEVKQLTEQGKTQREIAEQLNLSLGAVNRLLKKIKAK